MNSHHHHRFLFKTFIAFSASLILISTFAFVDSSATITTSNEKLLPDKQLHDVSWLVTRLVEHSHYLQQPITNELSIWIFNSYLDVLDPNRLYFTQADIDKLSRYRKTIAADARRGKLDGIYDIFNLYQQRVQERIDYALSVLDQEPDLSGNNEYHFDREHAPWPEKTQELETAWRERVLNDVISLRLADKSWEEARDTLKKRYQRIITRTGQLRNNDVFELFMNTFTHAFDPHSNYFSPQNAEEYEIQMRLSYKGIGASLQLDEDYVKIVEILPGGPAAIDGRLMPEDRIVGVAQGKDGEMVDVIGWRLEDVVDLIRGPESTTVRLQILPVGAAPGDQERTIDLIRDEVKLEARAAQKSMYEIKSGDRMIKIGVITVPSFYRDIQAAQEGKKDYPSTSADVRRLVEELKSEGMDGLLLDLRGNGGGHLIEATALTGLFVDQGPVVQLRNARGSTSLEEDPIPGEIYGGPLAVLVDRQSASASEIFAAAIQDYQRGLVIGQQTFGKGTVQTLYELDSYADRGEDFGQLTLTVGKFYRVTGASTQHRGVLPDISLPALIDPKLIGEDVEETALPWDQIAATGFEPEAQPTYDVSALALRHEARSNEEVDYRFLLDAIDTLQKERDTKTLSLNLEQRRQERKDQDQKRLALENARRSGHSDQPGEMLSPAKDVDDIEFLDLEEITRHSAAEIVADMVVSSEPSIAANDKKTGSEPFKKALTPAELTQF